MRRLEARASEAQDEPESYLMTDPALLVVMFATFLLAGTVKGVIGLGLPTVSLGLLTVVLDLPSAMALMVVPSLVTNLWQGVAGGNLKTLSRRLWPFLLGAVLPIWLGAQALGLVAPSLLSGLLGLLLIIYAASALIGIRPTITPGQERLAGPAFGAVNGVLTGMTGSFVVPGVMYLSSLGLPRDQLVQAMGLLFAASTLALAAALGGAGLWTAELGTLSLLALIPALLGMRLGAWLRQGLSETTYRRVFFVSILLLGLYICGRAVLAAL